MTERWTLRVIVSAVVAVLFTGVVLAVPTVASPFKRLVNVEADGPEPLWNVPLDSAAIRRAATLLPDGDVKYYVHAPPEADTTALGHDILGATYLYFPPALPVRKPADAEFVLSYHAATLVPRGLKPLAVHPVGDRVFLVRVR